MTSVLDISSRQKMPAKDKAGGDFRRLNADILQDEKTVGLRQLSQAIETHLIRQYNLDTEVRNVLNIVMMRSPQKEKSFIYRIFDTAEAMALKFAVKDYAALSTHPELILYEGWIDEDSNHVEMKEKRGIIDNIPLLTKDEIKKEIEALSEPGSSSYFFQAHGSSYGGPLGRGALIVELNQAYNERNVSKYIIYKSNMVGKILVGERKRLWRSNSAEKTAELIMVGHHKRNFSCL